MTVRATHQTRMYLMSFNEYIQGAIMTFHKYYVSIITLGYLRGVTKPPNASFVLTENQNLCVV